MHATEGLWTRRRGGRALKNEGPAVPKHFGSEFFVLCWRPLCSLDAPTATPHNQQQHPVLKHRNTRQSSARQRERERHKQCIRL